MNKKNKNLLGRVEEKVSEHLKELSGLSDVIKNQFFYQQDENLFNDTLLKDPLLELKNMPIKGAVRKYKGRILVELTMRCPSHCRFCSRRWMKENIDKYDLTKSDIDNIIKYITDEKDLREVVISGGDPLFVSDSLIYFLKKIKSILHIKVLRIHTRIPISEPDMVSRRFLHALKKIKKQALYLSIHINHVHELTHKTVRVLNKIQQARVILYSQTVFLKGINDSVEVLKDLFNRLVELGVRPLYIYRCDPVKGIGHFIVPFDSEVKIMSELIRDLSGIACPTYVIDAPNGSGKVPVPLNFWKFDKSGFTDFNGKLINI